MGEDNAIVDEKNEKPIKILPPLIVRVLAIVLLIADIAFLVIVGSNMSTFGAVGWLIVIGTVATLYFPIKAIQTGDPEWVLLDLILGP